MKKIQLLFILLYPLFTFSQSISQFIAVDQFGYRPTSNKVAVLRNPEIGWDANENYTPSATYAVVDASTCVHIYTGVATVWNSGKVDSISGDKAWWFDFSSVSAPGVYYILDIDNNLRSYSFEIRDNIYSTVLKHAVRSFYYQRSGYAKTAPFADEGWVDPVNHVGPLQDKNCRSYLTPNDVNSERDVHGGWFDAGDYNKYTSWTASYIIELLKAYEENPTVWTDDYNLPESGNNIPDILDEVKWGMDFLLRLQKTDGSVISIVGAAHASPSSAATGKSIYGAVSSSATLKSAAAYAFGARVYKKMGLNAYADTLFTAAVKAWDWADANPAVVWSNNDATYQSVSATGVGDMEVNDYTRVIFKLEAAVYLFDGSSDAKYKTYFDNNYKQSHLYQWSFAYPYESSNQDALLQYTKLTNGSSAVITDIKSKYNAGMTSPFSEYTSKKDPYKAYIGSYTWGSNSVKCLEGLMFYNVPTYNTNSSKNADALIAAENYIHYIHGVNPLRKVYLSNMNKYGADNSVTEFYHAWFENGSSKWDKVGVSTFGPAPGFLVGGPNPSYNVNSCCPNNCGGPANNALCKSLDVSKIIGQPAQKSYMDFNNSWPIDSWEVTENSCGYQVSYIRLLSKFITNNSNSSPVENCGTSIEQLKSLAISIYPNPSETAFNIQTTGAFKANIYSIDGKLIESFEGNSSHSFGYKLTPGYYLIEIHSNEQTHTARVVKY